MKVKVKFVFVVVLITVTSIYMLNNTSYSKKKGREKSRKKVVKEYRPKGTKGGPMVRVPAGKFTMGFDCFGPNDEKPAHIVQLSGYLIDRYEVTVDNYSECVQVGKCKEPKKDSEYDKDYNWGEPDKGNHPINGLSWHDAKSYCEYAGKRLPTEAEWEKAARGTDGRIYPWGGKVECATNKGGSFKDNMDCSKVNIAYCRNRGNIGTSPVGSYPGGASPYGAMDMAGNVYEWVSDWYWAGYYRNSPKKDPKGAPSGKGRVKRGGGYNSKEYGYAGTMSRSWGKPDSKDNPHIGFRCAMDAK